MRRSRTRRARTQTRSSSYRVARTKVGVAEVLPRAGRVAEAPASQGNACAERDHDLRPHWRPRHGPSLERAPDSGFRIRSAVWPSRGGTPRLAFSFSFGLCYLCSLRVVFFLLLLVRTK